MTQLQSSAAQDVRAVKTHSIAAGCAQAFAEPGVELALTYINESAKPFVQPAPRPLSHHFGY